MPTTNSRYSFFRDHEKWQDLGKLRRAWRQLRRAFQRANDSPDWVFPSSHCKDVYDRPVYEPSGFDLPRAIWRGAVSAPCEGSKAGGARTIGKGSKRWGTRSMLKPCPLRTSAFEARYPPVLLPLFVLPTNFALVEGPVRPTPQGYGRDCRSSRRVQVGKRHPSNYLAADLRSCQGWPWFLPPTCTLQPPSLQSLCPNSGTQKLILSEKVETFALTRPTKGTPIRAGFAFSSLSIQSRVSEART